MRWPLPVALLVVTSWSQPSLAQLPVFVLEAEELAPAAPPIVDPPPPAAPPPAPAAPPTSPAPARAQVIGFGQHPYDDDDDDLPAAGPRRTWYGWQTLIVDGAALSAVLLGVAIDGNGRDGGAIAGAGLLAYEFGPGIVHFVHRNPGRAFGSFGIRLGMPLVGAVLGATVSSNCDGYECEGDGAGAGLLLGMAGAIAIDAAVFAYDDRRPHAERARSRWVPLASFRPGRAWIGLGGEL
ncbi:MAG: hypothetical protein K0R38_1677 [Polyangiaceae bacterium]|nr:hypothetical protein [Polyangiaceae bacterium]